MTIDISTFIFKEDIVGKALLAELMVAVDRGVEVRLLVDSIGSLDPRRTGLKALIAHGKDAAKKLGKEEPLVKVKVFHPLFHPLKWMGVVVNFIRNLMLPEEVKRDIGFYRLNRRLHDKIFAIDVGTEQAIIQMGGRNLSEDYHDIPESKPTTFHDMEVIVKNIPDGDPTNNPGLRMQAYYDKTFRHMGNAMITNALLWLYDRPFYKKRMALQKRAMEEAVPAGSDVEKQLKDMMAKNFLDDGFEKDMKVDFVNELHNMTKRKAFVDPHGKHNRINGNSILRHLRENMEKAERSIKIISPYMYLTPKETKMLQDWLDADPRRELTIISNSIQTTDNHLTQAMVDRILAPSFMDNPNWKPKREGQVKIMGYGRLDGVVYGGDVRYGKLHAKYFIIDGEYAYEVREDKSPKSAVTTSNWDPRSRNLQLEIGYIMEGKETAKVLLDHFAKTEAGSTLWGSEEWLEIRAHKINRKMTKMQTVIYWFIQHTGFVKLI